MAVMRSIMYVPGNNPKMVEKAPSIPADIITLDLEDSVPPSEKEAARKLVAEKLKYAGSGGAQVYVRINNWETEMTNDDLEAVVWEGLDGVTLAKTGHPDDVKRLDWKLEELERRRGIPVGTVKISMLLETAKGIMNAYECCMASSRNVNAIFGAVDYCRDMRVKLTSEAVEQMWGRAKMAIAARAAAIIAEIEADYGTVFAKTEVTLNGEKDPGNRTQETNLGDLITDALVWGAEQQGETVDAAITNGGGIRATIEAGDITKKDVNTVLPFGNTLSIIKITGTELLEVLEASTFCTPEAIGGFPQVSGIEFTVDTTKGYDQGDEYPGTTYFAPKTINRVTIKTVGGKDFDPAATYTIATNDFMASGGDTYYRFVNATANYDLGIPMDEVVMDYITTVLNGTVAADKYGEPAGRIHVLVS